MELAQTARLLTAAAAFSPRDIASDDRRVVQAWHAVIGDLDYGEASRAVQAHYRESKWPVTPADIAERVKANRPPAIEKHFQCPSHPDQYADKCDHCPRQIAAGSNADTIAEVRELMRRMHADSKMRREERESARKAELDEKYQARMERAAKDEQKAALLEHIKQNPA